MKLDDILKLIEAAQKTDFDTVELEDGEFTLRMERNRPVQQVLTPVHVSAQPAADMVQAMPAAAPAPATAPAAEEAPAGDSAEKKVPGSKDLTSPLVGIFHKLPGGKAVKIGDKLKKGDVICIIEAMKLMNEIQMPEDGEIVWAAADDGESVEYGQLLYSYV